MKFITQTLIFTLLFLGVQTLQAQKKVLHHTALAKHLPSSVKGYTADGEVEGATLETNGASYSTVAQEYKKGNLELNLTLIDYSEAEQLYQATTMPWSMGMSIDTNDEKANGVDINGFKGWEVYQKKDKEASIILGVHNHYIFSAQCTDCTTEVLRSIVKSLNLSTLPK